MSDISTSRTLAFVNMPKPPPIPGRRPLGGPGAKLPGLPRIGGQAPSLPGVVGPSTPSSSGSGSLKRPPWIPVVIAAVLLCLEFWLVSKERNLTQIHLVGALLGMFGSVALLGWFRQSLNLRRSTSSFSEWSGPFESTRYMSVLVFASWALGAIHLYISVYEILRPGG